MIIRTFLDRLEGDKAVLYDEAERQAVIPAAWIPEPHEGMAVDLHITENPVREAAARKEAEALLRDIQNRKE